MRREDYIIHNAFVTQLKCPGCGSNITSCFDCGKKFRINEYVACRIPRESFISRLRNGFSPPQEAHLCAKCAHNCEEGKCLFHRGNQFDEYFYIKKQVSAFEVEVIEIRPQRNELFQHTIGIKELPHAGKYLKEIPFEKFERVFDKANDKLRVAVLTRDCKEC